MADIKTIKAAPVLLIGSASPHTARIVAGLCRAGQPVVLVSNAAMNIEPSPALLHCAVLDLSVTAWRTTARLRELITRWAPKVVHAQQANSVGWHAARAVRGSGVPLVLTLWGSDVLLLPARGLLHRRLVRTALQGASAWTADARVVLEAARALVPAPARPVHQALIPLGIDEAVLDPANAPPRERRLLSCRLHKPLYRIDAIIRAFARLAPAHPGWVLEVAGAGTETPALQALATELGMVDQIEFTGFLSTDELRTAYRRAALFVSVPESDGTSVSLLEALGSGCIPVVSDLPANREWIVDRLNGFLVARLDRFEDDLTEAMAVWEAQIWGGGPGAMNQALVRRTAVFTRNIEQFMELYDRVNAR